MREHRYTDTQIRTILIPCIRAIRVVPIASKEKQLDGDPTACKSLSKTCFSEKSFSYRLTGRNLGNNT
jgi:hypothetical protein